MRLSDLKKGEKAIVVKVSVIYKILGSEIAIRLDTASMIEVRLISHYACKSL